MAKKSGGKSGFVGKINSQVNSVTSGWSGAVLLYVLIGLAALYWILGQAKAKKPVWQGFGDKAADSPELMPIETVAAWPVAIWKTRGLQKTDGIKGGSDGSDTTGA